MSYEEDITETFYHFSEEERNLITKKLEKWGYKWDTNTTCGNCCGMFADYIYVNGIGGKWLPKHQKEMIKFLKEKGIDAGVDIDHKYSDGSGFHHAYTISADPKEFLED